jgi:hypothetical protein
MVKPVPSSHRARPCSCSSKTGPCRASSRDFLQISMTLHLWPIELVDGKIAIVSSMRIRIMPFTISTFFELFRRWYDMITWQFNLFFLQRVIKDPITLSDIKSVTHLVLSAFRSRLQARSYKWFRFGPQIYSATYMSASSSSGDSSLYSTMLT